MNLLSWLHQKILWRAPELRPSPDEGPNLEREPEAVVEMATRLLGSNFHPRLVLHTEINATSLVKKHWTKEGNGRVESGAIEDFLNTPKIKYFTHDRYLHMFANDRLAGKFWRIQQKPGKAPELVSTLGRSKPTEAGKWGESP